MKIYDLIQEGKEKKIIFFKKIKLITTKTYMMWIQSNEQ